MGSAVVSARRETNTNGPPMIADSEASNALLPLAVRFCEADPVAGAHALEALTEEQALEVLGSLSRGSLRKLLPMMPPSFVSSAVAGDQAGRATPILERGGAEVCSSVLLSLRIPWAISPANSLLTDMPIGA